MKVRMQDIAKAGGVTVGTVSRALAGSSRISFETRKMLYNIAERMGYRVKCRNMAIILPGVEMTDYCASMCTALSTHLMRKSFHPFIVHIQHLDMLNELPVCGAISILSENRLSDVWKDLHQWPLVAMNTKSNRLNHIYRVSSNEKQGMELIVNQLVNAGHNRIARLGGIFSFDEPDNWSSSLRNKFFNGLANRYNLEKNLKIKVRPSLEDILKALSSLLNQKPTALVIETEDYLLPVLHALRVLKVRIPGDLSLASWTYESVQCHTEPTVCGIMQDYNGLAAAAAEIQDRISRGLSVNGDTEINYIPLPGVSIRNLNG